MPRRALVILVLAVGCGPKDTTLAMPDAEEFIDSPPFVFPDAPPRADARTMPDAKINPPDAKAGTPDAPPAIDAAAGTPDAPPPIDAPPPTPDAPPPMIDAPGTPDAPATGGIRPLPGTLASLRILDFQQFGPDVGTKVCVFGTDADPRPYAVLAGVSHHSSETSYTVDAVYTDVPSDPVGLALQVFTTFTGPPDTTTDGCDAAQAVPLPTLTQDGFYTLARTSVDDFFSDCDSGTGTACSYFPRWDPNDASTTCAPSHTYLLSDGDVSTFGWRVINLTSNAAEIGYSETADSWTDLLNLDLDATSAKQRNAAVGAATKLNVCPEYLEACLVPPLGVLVAVEHMDACTNGDPTWLIGTITTSRIADSLSTTTFYIVGDAKALSQDTMSMVGSDVTVVEAHEIIE